MKKKMPYAVLSTTLAAALLLGTAGQNVALADDHDHAGHQHEEVEIDRNLDTDGDGLKDWFEQSISHSYKADTDSDGTTDADEDYDGDGLSNYVEQMGGTNPNTADTDGDTLSDYEEVHKFKTSPLIYDTDGDNLSDGTEILKYNLDPNTADQDGDGVLDGMVARSYTIPANDLGITGTLTGTGDIPFKLTVRQSPVLILKNAPAANTFSLESLDPDATFKVTVPTGSSDKNDLRLYRYQTKNATLEEVQTQHHDPKTGTISAEFTGGGSFVVMSQSEYKKSLRSDKASYKGKFKEFKGKAKIHGMPGVEVDGAAIKADGTFDIERKVKASDGAEQTLKATYKVGDMQVGDNGTFLSATAITTESGLQPTILIHGLNSNSQAFGFNNKWKNGASPSAETAISSTQTFTKVSYASGATSTYGNVDVHFITSVSDSAELGPILDTNKGYTPNVDLFIYEYDANGHVGTAANGLKSFITNLTSKAIIPAGTVNLVGHSKGGLVSRYYIENLSGSSKVARLVTLGTPHFGSDWATFGDLDRDDSRLWLTTKSDASCATFTNSHPYTKYYLFGGFTASAGDLNATSPIQRGLWSGVAHLPTSNYDTDVRNRFKNAGNEISWASYADVEDGWVNIDSAMGSDREPDYDGTLTTLTVRERFYLFHETYGDHSAMRKYAPLQNMVDNVLKGLRD